MTGAIVAGAGACLPDRLVTNDDLAARVDTSDEWIRTRTGIGTRWWAGEGVSTGDLAVEAGRRAMTSAGMTRVDAVIVATTTPDRLCPATAPEVAARLGMVGVAAHDVAAVCTGFLYGLANAVGLIASGCADSVLLIGAETFSTILNPADRATSVVFGDGAGALVIVAGTGDPAEDGKVGPCVLGSDGSLYHLIQIPAGGSRQRSTGVEAPPADYYFQMTGKEVFRRAVEQMTSVAMRALDRAGLTPDEIDHVVPHQANIRISDAVAKRLGMEPGKMLSNVQAVGNTAAASIPILLAEANADGRIKAGDRLLLVAFGGGITWGATTLSWPNIPALIGHLNRDANS